MTKLTRAQVEEMAELKESGWSDKRLAKRYGVSVAAIHYRCLREGAVGPGSQPAATSLTSAPCSGFGGKARRFSIAEDQQLLELARSGMKIDKVADHLGRPRTSCRIRLMKLELSEEAAG